MWSLLGAAAGALGAAIPFVVASALVAAAFVLPGLLGVELAPPGFTWQVPSPWLRGKSDATRLLVWAAILGPGLLTRNPYASMWLVPLLLGATGSSSLGLAFGAAAGAAHGAARALGILVVQHDLRKWSTPVFVLAYFRWKAVDRLLLAFASGLLAVTLALGT